MKSIVRLAFCLVVTSTAIFAADTRKPNILIIFTDDKYQEDGESPQTQGKTQYIS